MIRVLHIVTDMNMGGIETMLMNYHRNIDKSKLQFDYLVHRKEKAAYDDEIIKLGGKIYRIPKLNPFSIKYRTTLNSFFKQHPEYQIVHCHLNCLSALPLKYAAKYNVRNRISHAHLFKEEGNIIKKIIKYYYRGQLPKYTTKQLACSSKAGHWLYKNDNFEIFHNAINAKDFAYNENIRKKIRSKYQINKELVIGHIGRFEKQKNHKFLINVFNEIHKLQPNSKLILVGTGSLLNKIKNKVAILNLQDSVLFLGNQKNVNELMQAFDVFVLPSLFEGLGIVNIEAQAAGLPCVVSNFVPNECKLTNNFLFINLNKSARKWAQSIIKLAKSKRINNSKNIIKTNYDILTNKILCEQLYFQLFKI